MDDDRRWNDKDLDRLEVELMVNIEDRKTSYKQLLTTSKQSLQAIRYLRKELEEYNQEYYLPDDDPEFFYKDHLIARECKKPKVDVTHHVVSDGIVTINHYYYRSKILAFWKYIFLMSEHIDDFVEISKYMEQKVEEP